MKSFRQFIPEQVTEPLNELATSAADQVHNALQHNGFEHHEYRQSDHAHTFLKPIGSSDYHSVEVHPPGSWRHLDSYRHEIATGKDVQSLKRHLDRITPSA